MEEDQGDGRSAQRTGGDSGERVAAPAKRRRWRFPLILGSIVAVPLLLVAAWTAIALHLSYSTGERAGYIQKFSQKGWVCKTYEGEIAMVNVPGATQERFAFSVRDDSVAHQITKLMGSRVALSYAQHKGIPGSCFGETEYYVTGVKAVP
jgi:hypothetical protein